MAGGFFGPCGNALSPSRARGSVSRRVSIAHKERVMLERQATITVTRCVNTRNECLPFVGRWRLGCRAGTVTEGKRQGGIGRNQRRTPCRSQAALQADDMSAPALRRPRTDRRLTPAPRHPASGTNALTSHRPRPRFEPCCDIGRQHARRASGGGLRTAPKPAGRGAATERLRRQPKPRKQPHPLLANSYAAR